MGGAALDLVGVPLPEETLSAAKQSHAVLLGAIGGCVSTSSVTQSTQIFLLLCLFAGKYTFRFDFDFRYKWDKNEKHLKPETGLLQLREGLKVFANLRPATVLPQVISPPL